MDNLDDIKKEIKHVYDCTPASFVSNPKDVLAFLIHRLGWADEMDVGGHFMREHEMEWYNK